MLYQSERDQSSWQHLSLENTQEVIEILKLIEVFAQVKLPGNKTTDKLAYAPLDSILNFAAELVENKQLWLAIPDTFLDGNGELVLKSELYEELGELIESCR